jgi:hypothetical protein
LAFSSATTSLPRPGCASASETSLRPICWLSFDSAVACPAAHSVTSRPLVRRAAHSRGDGDPREDRISRFSVGVDWSCGRLRGSDRLWASRRIERNRSLRSYHQRIVKEALRACPPSCAGAHTPQPKAAFSHEIARIYRSLGAPTGAASPIEEVALAFERIIRDDRHIQKACWRIANRRERGDHFQRVRKTELA